MQLNSQFKFPLFLKSKRLKELCNCSSGRRSNSGKGRMYKSEGRSFLLEERGT